MRAAFVAEYAFVVDTARGDRPLQVACPRADRLTDIDALGRILLAEPTHPGVGTHVLNGLVSYLLLTHTLEGVAYSLDTVFAETAAHGEIMAIFRGIAVRELLDTPPAAQRPFHDVTALLKRVRSIFAPSEEQTHQALQLLCQQPAFIEAVIRQDTAPTREALAQLPDAGDSMVDAMIATHVDLFALTCMLGSWGRFSAAAITRARQHATGIFAAQVAAGRLATNEVVDTYVDEKIIEKQLWADSWRTMFIKMLYTDKDGEGLRRAKVMQFLLNEMPDVSPLQQLACICAMLHNDASTKLRLDLIEALDPTTAYAKLIAMLQFYRGEAVSESLDDAKGLCAAVDGIIAAINAKVNYPTAEGMAQVAAYFTPELARLAALQNSTEQVVSPASTTDVLADFIG